MDLKFPADHTTCAVVPFLGKDRTNLIEAHFPASLLIDKMQINFTSTAVKVHVVLILAYHTKMTVSPR